MKPKKKIKCPFCSKKFNPKFFCRSCLPERRVRQVSDGIFSIAEKRTYSDTPMGRIFKKYGSEYDYSTLITKPLKYEEDK